MRLAMLKKFKPQIMSSNAFVHVTDRSAPIATKRGLGDPPVPAKLIPPADLKFVPATLKAASSTVFV